MSLDTQPLFVSLWVGRLILTQYQVQEVCHVVCYSKAGGLDYKYLTDPRHSSCLNLYFYIDRN